MSVTISVVIPTHKRPDFLKRAIDSVLSQTKPADEIVVVDDAACDITRSLVQGYDLSFLHYVENIDGQGASSSRNLGVERASSEYIAFLDDDDMFFRDKLEVVSRYINNAGYSLDVIYHPAKIVMVNEGVHYFSSPHYYKEKSEFITNLAIHNFVGGTPMVVVKRSAFIESGMFDESLSALEDYEMWLRMAVKGFHFSRIYKPLTKYFYVTRESSVSKNIENNLAAVKQIEHSHRSVFKMLNHKQVDLHEAWVKRMVVHKFLLNGQLRKAMSSQIGLLIDHRKLRDLLMFFAMFMGIDFVFKMRSKIK